jgi:hypothetical protein
MENTKLLQLVTAMLEVYQAVFSNVLDAFSVTSITKPNAGIKGITSSLHLLLDNLTKKTYYIQWLY